MKIVKISNEFYKIIKSDKEALDKDTRLLDYLFHIVINPLICLMNLL